MNLAVIRLPTVGRPPSRHSGGPGSICVPTGGSWCSCSRARSWRSAAEIAIPLLTKSMIDGAISHGERSLLLPIGAAAVGLGVVQALLNFLRRWMQANAVTGMEQSMRADIYAHLQRLPPAFHDEWQSGQLLSRATTDLSAIRRFAGFGTIFLVTNVVTFIAVVLLLIRLNWWLGLLTATVFLPVVVASTRFEQHLPGDVPARPGPAGRPGHLRRGGGDRDPRAQGARPGRRGRRAASRPGPRGVRDRDAEGPAAQHVLGRPGPDPERADRRSCCCSAPSRPAGTS